MDQHKGPGPTEACWELRLHRRPDFIIVNKQIIKSKKKKRTGTESFAAFCLLGIVVCVRERDFVPVFTQQINHQIISLFINRKI